MKKLLLALLTVTLLLSWTDALGQLKIKVGEKVPEWVFTDADKKEFTMNSWDGKVLQINYVDPDESDLNDEYNDYLDKAVDIDKRIDKEYFKGFGIVDCKSTWKPNGLIRMIAGNKAKKYDTTILFDYDGVLQNDWGMPKDSYSVVIVDKNRVCRAVYSGKIAPSEYEKIVQLIIQLTKE
ncbi:MAG: YtfJ family protein [Bacteroidales bacterium]|jgi:predicted transcriptional regulator|nr:YtfJ family protein [Bacteroidales bacterium]